MEASFPKIILFAIILCAPFLAGFFPAIGDMRDVYIPLELFFQENIRQGDIPFWNADVAWGFPVLASAQIGFYYPVLLLSRLLLPIWLYLPVIIFLHIAAAGIGMYLFVQQLGLKKYPALLAAIIFMGSAWLWQHGTHLNIFLATCWLPWQLTPHQGQ